MVISNGIEFETQGLKRLVGIAKTMLHLPISSFLHYSFLVDKNKPIAVGVNDVTCAGVRINKCYYFYPLGGVHAEANCLKNFRGSYSRLKMVNIRLNKRGELRYSRPCELCYHILKEQGIKRLYYSTESKFNFERI